MTALATPIRAGVFQTVEQAEHAVARLQTAGFSNDQITVVSSDPAVQRLFAEFDHQHPSGDHAVAGAAVGGSLGAALGGATAATLAATTLAAGSIAMATGGVGILGGAAVGSLIGAMLTRGVERELADYYAQALVDGHILVAADSENPTLHAAAERALQAEGAHAAPLPEG